MKEEVNESCEIIIKKEFLGKPSTLNEFGAIETTDFLRKRTSKEQRHVASRKGPIKFAVGYWSQGEISNFQDSIKKLGTVDYDDLLKAITTRSRSQIANRIRSVNNGDTKNVTNEVKAIIKRSISDNNYKYTGK